MEQKKEEYKLSSYTKRKLNERIDKGVKYLDKRLGRVQWLQKINLERLQLNDSKTCIIGQAFGNFWDEIKKDPKNLNGINNKGSGEKVFFITPEDYGKILHFYDNMTILWNIRITSLRKNLYEESIKLNKKLSKTLR